MKKFLIILVTIFSFHFLFSQSQLPTGAVTGIPSEAIQQYWLKAQTAGYDLSTIGQLAASQGLSSSEIEVLVSRIKELPGGSDKADIKAETNMEDSETPTNELDEAYTTTSVNKNFGYDIFNTAGNYSQLNIPTPKSYILGPKDKLLIELYGATEKTFNLEVSVEGKISLPLTGPLHVGGLNIQAVESLLVKTLSKRFSGLVGENPSVFLGLTLKEIRSISINIVGEVGSPGIYQIPAYSNVLNALFTSNGITEIGTLRDIKVFRAGKHIASYDLFEYLLFGKTWEQFSLTDNDLILVGVFNKRVEVTGEVKRPGIFEIKEGENLSDLLFFAGGVAKNAHTETISIERRDGMNPFVKDVDPNQDGFEFLDGDKILVREEVDFVKEVTITGAVQRPGNYEWNPSLKIQDLIRKAGGLHPKAYVDQVRILSKGSYWRDSGRNVDLASLVEEDSSSLLKVGDIIHVPNRLEGEDSRLIEISGKVEIEGVLPFYDGMRVSDALMLSGGITTESLNGFVEIARRISSDNDIDSYEIINLRIPAEFGNLETSELNHELKPFDHVFVRNFKGYRDESTVQASGEFEFPGEYIISDSEMRVSDLIDRAGGLTSYAFTDGVFLLRDQSRVSVEHLDREKISEMNYLKQRLSSDEAIGNSLTQDQLEVLQERLENLEEVFIQKYYGSYTAFEKLTDSLVSKSPIKPKRVGLSISKIMEDPDSEENLILLPGDKITVPRANNTVSITGSVLYPNTATYSSDRSFRDYVTEAGGYSLTAKPGRSYIVYANGSAQKVKRFLFLRKWPEVKAGSTLVVTGGRERVSGLGGVQQVFSILTGAAGVVTTYYLILNLRSTN